MMGRNHIKLGAVFALGTAVTVAQLGGLFFAPDIVLAVSQASGYALAPDIDSRTATATRAFPPITIPAHWLVVWTHRIVYALTRRGDDPPSRRPRGRPKPRVRARYGLQWLMSSLFGYARPWQSAHRGITHSIFAAAVLCAALGVLMFLGSPLWAVLVILAGVLLGGRLVFATPVLVVYVVAAFIYFGPYEILDHVRTMAPLWATSMFVGLVSHVCGDSCTKSGAPLWAPITWQTYRTPLYFETNKWFEQNIVKWVLTAMVVYLSAVLVNLYFHGAIIAVLHALAAPLGMA